MSLDREFEEMFEFSEKFASRRDASVRHGTGI